MLTSKQRAEFRAQANSLETTLMVGKDGVTEAVLTVSDAVLAAADETESLATTTATLTVVNGTVQHG